MDIRYPGELQTGRASANRHDANRHGRFAAFRRVAWVVSTLLVCLLGTGNWVATPSARADDGELPVALGIPLDSVDAQAPSEIGYSSADAAGETSVSTPYPSKADPYDQYVGQPSRPDRWDSAGPQFPWLESPGYCDDWRVGPVLSVRADGLFLYRTNVASAFLTNTLGANPEFVNRFEDAGGARAYVTSRYSENYAVQVGYVGAADWYASAESRFTDGVNPLLDATRLNSYDSSLHAVELNLLPYSHPGAQWLMGVRYIDFGEDFSQLTDRVNFDINNNNLATGLNDDVSTLHIDNRLIGPQLGLRGDRGWRQQRFSLETLVNGGPFCNLISRKEIDQTFVTVNALDDPMTVADESQQTQVRVAETARHRRATELAFFGEAALTGVYRFYPNFSVRAGYQAIWLSGANLASDRFGETSTVFFHGLNFGVEYRR